MAKKTDGLEIEAQVLAGAMRHIASIVRPSTLPILSNVRIEAKGDVLQLTSSDMDVELTRIVSLTRGGNMTTTVNAKRLHDMAQSLDPGARITLSEVDADRLEVKSGRSRWQLPMIDVGDFPSIDFKPDNTCPVAGPEFRAAIDRVIGSVLTDKAAAARPSLGGVFMHDCDGTIGLAASDGNRLAVAHTNTPWPEGSRGIIILPKFINSLGALSSDDAGEIPIGWTDNRIAADGGSWRIIGKVVDQEYVDYRRIVPGRQGTATAVFDGDAMRRSVKRVQLMHDRDSRIVLTFAPDKIVMTANSGEGMAREEVPAECSADFTTAFNGNYIAQAMQQVGGDTVRLQMSGPGDVARVERVVEDGMVAVIMPMRI